MYELQFVDMPDEFTRLLRVDMQSSSKYHMGLQYYILTNPSLKGIVDRILNAGEEVDINSQMKSLGWHGIRDRILSYYLIFVSEKIHSEKIDISYIDDILDLERSLRFSTVSGYSRIILYAFYLKLSSFENGISDFRNHPLYPSADVIDILKKSQERVIKVDYLILLISHLLEFFEKDKVEAMIDQNFSYESVYLKLSESQKETLCENFLTYCASINESEIFSSKKV